jgi:hypothetical protein
MSVSFLNSIAIQDCIPKSIERRKKFNFQIADQDQQEQENYSLALTMTGKSAPKIKKAPTGASLHFQSQALAVRK